MDTSELLKRSQLLASELVAEQEQWAALTERCGQVTKAVTELGIALELAGDGLSSLAGDAPQWPINALLQGMRDRTGHLRDRFGETLDDAREQGGLALERLEDALGGLASQAEAMVEGVASLATEVSEAVESGMEAVESLGMRLAGSGDALVELSEQALLQAFEDGLDEAFEQLAELAEDTGLRAEEIFSDIDERIDAAAAQTSDYLADISENLIGALNEFSERYVSLVNDLTGLGEDLERIHTVVTTAMEGGGLGMETAAGALNDLRDTMSGVA